MSERRILKKRKSIKAWYNDELIVDVKSIAQNKIERYLRALRDRYGGGKRIYRKKNPSYLVRYGKYWLKVEIREASC